MDGEKTARYLESVLDLDKYSITQDQAIEIEQYLFQSKNLILSDKSKPFTACALFRKKNTFPLKNFFRRFSD